MLTVLNKENFEVRLKINMKEIMFNSNAQTSIINTEGDILYEDDEYNYSSK